MIRFVVGQLRGALGRVVVLGLVVGVAAVSVVALQAVAVAGELESRELVEEHFDSAYHLLVRPEGSQARLEREEGLVRANYLSGVFGGISAEQWESVLRLEGVEVAAPVANVGYVAPAATVDVDIDHLLDPDAGAEVFRVSQEWVGQAGLSVYPDRDVYVYVTNEHTFMRRSGDRLVDRVDGRFDPEAEGTEFGNMWAHEKRGTDDLLEVCGPVNEQVRQQGITGAVFNREPLLRCFSTLSPEVNYVDADGDRRAPGVVSLFYPPTLLAAVDPQQEALLLGLDDMIVEGDYLDDDAHADSHRAFGDGRGVQLTVPVVASVRTFVDEMLSVEVQRLDVPDGVDVGEQLASEDAAEFLAGLSGEQVDSQEHSAAESYTQILDRYAMTDQWDEVNFAPIDTLWTTEEVAYEQLGDRLRPVDVEVDDVELRIHDQMSYPRAQPPSVEDSDYRQVWARKDRQFGYGDPPDEDSNIPPGVVGSGHGLEVVGRFDPELLPGFSELSAVPLQSYYPPELRAGDARSEELLADAGGVLRPTMDLTGYVPQPPLFLTHLDAIDGLYDPRNYQVASADEANVDRDAPISVIRVRAEGVDAPTEANRQRLEQLAARIRDLTGLQVDVTVGSSPTEVTVELPEGQFGRPMLTLAENWVSKGVSFEVLGGLDRRQVGLLAVVQAVGALVVVNGALAAVRSRRSEIGTLRSFGWTRRQVFGAVLGELAATGLIGGVAMTGVAVAVLTVVGVPLAQVSWAWVTPLAVAVSVVAGLAPAAAASRVSPVRALRPPVVATQRARTVGSVAAMAWRNTIRLPGRTLLAGLSLAVAVTALTSLAAVNLAYRGLLTDTRLGVALSDQIRGSDYLLAVLAVTFGVVAVAQVLYLNLRERAPELAVLQAAGWTRAKVRRLGLWEAAIIAVLGSLAGGLAGAAVTAAYTGTADWGPVLAVTGVATIAVTAAVAVTTFTVTANTTRQPAAATLGAAQ